MGNDGRKNRQGATESAPRPAEFPLGSEISRAAARATLEARASNQEQMRLVVMKAGEQLALDTDTCVQILKESGVLPKASMCLLDFTSVPHGLNAAELEEFLREHGTELCGSRTPL